MSQRAGQQSISIAGSAVELDRQAAIPKLGIDCEVGRVVDHQHALFRGEGQG